MDEHVVDFVIREITDAVIYTFYDYNGDQYIHMARRYVVPQGYPTMVGGPVCGKYVPTFKVMVWEQFPPLNEHGEPIKVDLCPGCERMEEWLYD